MSQPGLSPEKFIQRIQGVENIADAWPYSHMPSEASSHTEAPYPIHSYSPGGLYTRDLLVDYVIKPQPDKGEGYVILKQGLQDGRQNSRISMTAAPSETDSWAMLQGVHLAASFELSDRVHHGSGTRYGILQRILAVEQPLRTPGRNFPVHGRGDHGYIHGEITEVLATEMGLSEGAYNLMVRLGREATASMLVRRRDTPVVRDSGHPVINGLVQEGDIIRTRVDRDDMDPRLFRPALYGDRTIRVVGTTPNNQ
jgi:hypothetical protein